MEEQRPRAETDNNDIFKSEAIRFPVVELPLDSEGFVKSFTIDQESEFVAFYEEYGFVCIANVVSQEDIEGTINEVWSFYESTDWSRRTVPLPPSRNDTTTWEAPSFPFSPLGIVGDGPSIGSYTWRNRQNETVYKAFATILKTEQLWVSLDRWGLMRPTKHVPWGKLKNPTVVRTTVEGEEAVEEGAVNAAKRRKGKLTAPWTPTFVDKPEWKTNELWLHWDLNPWVWTSGTEGVDYSFVDFITENNGSRNDGCGKVQGILTLVDSRIGDGGFCCVPGFHKHLKEYAEKTKHSAWATNFCRRQNYEFNHVHPDDPMNTQVKKISARAGTLIIWNSELPHCNYPNDSSRFRINQYIKMFRSQEGKPGVWQRKMFVQQLLGDFQPSELGQKLFGLKPW
jgi:hypothetical protein